MTEHTTLPTIEECKEFLALVNKGRVAVDLEPLETLEFDAAVPLTPQHCLSATNLFCVIEWDPDNSDTWSDVGSTTFRGPSAIVAALNAPVSGGNFGANRFLIPDAIRCVTDPFDSETPGLRERLVEAGVVAP